MYTYRMNHHECIEGASLLRQAHELRKFRAEMLARSPGLSHSHTVQLQFLNDGVRLQSIPLPSKAEVTIELLTEFANARISKINKRLQEIGLAPVSDEESDDV